MTGARARELVIDVGFALVFALSATLGDILLIAIPLYQTPGCPPNYCVPIAPRIHLVPLVAGVLTALAWSRVRLGRAGWHAAVRGLLLGIGSVLLFGLAEAAAEPFRNAYFTTPYRAFALAYSFGIVFVLGAIVARLVTTDGQRFDRTGGAALVLVLAAVVLQFVSLRLLLPAAAMSAAAVLGGLVGATVRSVPRLRSWHVLTVLIVLAFAVRAFFGIQTLMRTGPGMAFAVASDDGDSYFTLATQLWTDPTEIGAILAGLAFPPGYILFCAVLLGLTGGTLAVVVIAQALLASLSTFLVYQLARPLFGVAAGIVAAGLFALDQNLIQNQSTLTAEALLVPLVLGTLVALASYAREERLRWMIVAAALLGFAFVTRNVVALPLLAAAVLWLAILHRSKPVRLVAVTAILVAGVLLASAPIAIATAQREGAPRFTTQLAGLSWIFEGGPGYTISNRDLIDRGINPFVDPGGSVLRAASDPGAVLRFYFEAAPQRLSTFLFFATPGFSDPLILINDAYFTNSLGETVRLLRLLAFVAGIAMIVRSRLWHRAPVVGLMAAYAALYIGVFVFLFPPYHAFRYRIPVEPLRFIVEAGGLAALSLVVRSALTERGTVPSTARRSTRPAVDHA